MKKYLLAAVLFLSTVTSCAIARPLLAAFGGGSGITDSAAPILKNVMPTVVNIVNQGEFSLIDNPFIKREIEQNKDYYQLLDKKTFLGAGSGIIIDVKTGLIVTNAHLVTACKKLTVTLSDGQKFIATKIGEDDETDVAVIKINAKNLQEIKFADSDKVKVGDFVLAIGSPFDLKQSVTSGIISALNRTDLHLEGIENFIQTDAPINSGNSGGAMVNTKGELVGMNTALMSPNAGNVGVGFAIPSNMVKSVAEQLIKYGDVKRGILGVVVQTLTPALANAFGINGVTGALVTQVASTSPAATAGIKSGDIIIQADNKNIISNDDLRYVSGLKRLGDKIQIVILRDNKKINLNVNTIKADEIKLTTTDNIPYFESVQLQNTTVQVPDYGYIDGVFVVDLDSYSSAGGSGLMPGDIIVSVDNVDVKNIKGLQEVINQNAKKDNVLLKLIRSNRVLFVALEK